MTKHDRNDFWMFGNQSRRGFMSGFRASRGMMEPAILSALQEKPMHGYELISALETKSQGIWRPSAGSIYPTLQLLEDKELLTSREQDGKKIYSLTKSGKQAASEAEVDLGDLFGDRSRQLHDFRQIHQDMSDIMHMMRTIYRKGSEAQKQALASQVVAFKQGLHDITQEDHL
jgi:DNA-binding PadR family transcriptional regulator